MNKLINLFIEFDKGAKWGLFFFTISFIITFIQISVLVDLLGEEVYGLWVIVLTFVNFINYFDFGVINGSRLELTRLYSSKKYFSFLKTIIITYKLVFIISIVISTILYASVNYFELAKKLDKQTIYSEFHSVLNITTISVGLLLLLKVSTVIYSSLQKPQVEKAVLLIGQSLFLIFIIVLKIEKLTIDLETIVTYYFIFLMIPLAILNFGVFKSFMQLSQQALYKIQSIKSTNNIWSYNKLFIVIQLCSFILYMTDNYLIGIYLNPSDITSYSLSYKYYGIPHLFFSSFVALHWQKLIELYNLNKIAKLKRIIRKFELLLFVSLIVLVIALILKPILFRFWVGYDTLKVNYFDIIFVIYFGLSSYAAIYTYIINASGELKLQRNIYLIIGLLNIPLSIIFLKTSLTSYGVILASLLCIIPLAVGMKHQSNRILKNV